MIPVKGINDVFPKFVPDQLLTSSDLNNLFNYLDEQERLTRANLIGIGIVCGLEVRIRTSGSSITISKGCGITSKGYMIAIDDTEYTQFTEFNALQQQYYGDKFVDTSVSPAQQKFDLWELHQASVVPEVPGAPQPEPLISLTLDDKVVLLFVELLENNNKNCNPNSCDDKGINVEVTIRPLLIKREDADELNILIPDHVTSDSFEALKQLKMRRWKVPVTQQPITTTDIINSFKSNLSTVFISNIKEVLTDGYNKFSIAILDEFPENPFEKIDDTFAFLNSNTNTSPLTFIQYFYDFFSDLLEAYNEFRVKGMEILSACCPDASLFPRHLLLGELAPVADSIKLAYRNYFIYSPLFEKKNLLQELKSLFRRMKLMVDNLQIPPTGSEIKITPGMLGNYPLSLKSIPYYYGPLQVFRSWNYEKFIHGKANENLSYNATIYNTPATSENDHIINPLQYDLELYNFLRIEGHIGLSYRTVLTNIQNLKREYRLPFDVVALRTGDPDLNDLDDAVRECNIKDLETSYEIVRREWEAIIGQTIEYLDDNMDGARSLLSGFEDSSDIGEYMKLLHTAINDYMNDNLLAFIKEYDQFIVVYENIELQSNILRTDLMQVLNDDKLSSDERNLAEDLIDHFDEVALSCKKGTFRSIHQEFIRRINDIYSYIFFSNYAEKNPGLQHKAGVTTGGTFIIVYNKINVEPVTITGNVNVSSSSLLFIIINVKGSTLSTFTSAADRSFSITVPSLPVVLQARAFTFFGFTELTGETLVDSTTVFPISFNLTGNTVDIPPDSGNNIPDETVFADFYLPYQCCSDCAPLNITIQELNRPPTAIPSVNPSEITLPQSAVTLDGSASTDPEGSSLTYSWTVTSSPPSCTITNPNAATTNVTGMTTAGVYEFILIVKDEQGMSSAPASVTVTVNPAPNQAPTAVASVNLSNITLPVSGVTLDGSASSDPEGSSLTFAWALASSPPSCNITNQDAAITTVTDMAAGVYEFILIVKDEQGMPSAPASVTVSVNQPPVANAGKAQTITLNTDVNGAIIPGSVNLNGSASTDPDGTIQSFLWQQVSAPAGHPATINDATADNPTVDNLFPGEYVFKLTVTDDKTAPDSDTVTITVNEPEQPEKTCGDLPRIINEFKSLNQVDQGNFGTFRNFFNSYTDIESFFQLMSAVQNDTVDQQIAFFKTTKVHDLTIVELLQRWLEQLFEIINNPNQKQLRLLALALYRILATLATYIACIQNEDVDKAVVPMEEVLNLVLAQLDSLNQDIVSSYLDPEKSQLSLLLNLFKTEKQRLKDNNEQDKKPKYADMLEKLIQVLKALGI
jgi:hypothetical protein